jgi:hypothetical protein
VRQPSSSSRTGSEPFVTVALLRFSWDVNGPPSRRAGRRTRKSPLDLDAAGAQQDETDRVLAFPTTLARASAGRATVRTAWARAESPAAHARRATANDGQPR